jgi:SRSO17 transposase
MLAQVRVTVLTVIESQGPIQAWIVDDTGFPKKGRHWSTSADNTAARSANRTTARLP